MSGTSTFNTSPAALDLLQALSAYVRLGTLPYITAEFVRYGVDGNKDFAKRLIDIEEVFGNLPSHFGSYDAELGLARRFLDGAELPEPGRRSVLWLADYNVTTLLTMHWVRALVCHARENQPPMTLSFSELDESLLPKAPSNWVALFDQFLVELGKGIAAPTEARAMLKLAFGSLLPGYKPAPLLQYLALEGVQVLS